MYRLVRKLQKLKRQRLIQFVIDLGCLPSIKDSLKILTEYRPNMV